jgi:hypothetical protein
MLPKGKVGSPRITVKGGEFLGDWIHLNMRKGKTF